MRFDNVVESSPRTPSLPCAILIMTSVLSAMPWRTSDAAGCLRYDFVSLTGTLVRQTYPGPPDYESVAKGDEPLVIWVLQLDQSICVADPDPRYPREYYEREVQLVVTPDQYARYKNLLGRKVIANGKLLHGGARYDKRLVLTVEEMSRTRH
jgi:hypothetical protein